MDNREITGMLPRAIENGDCGNFALLQFLFEKSIKIKRDDTSHVAFTTLDQICNSFQCCPFTPWRLALSVELGSEFFEKDLLSINCSLFALFSGSLSSVSLHHS